MIGECIQYSIFKAIIDSTYNALIIVDKRGKILVFNQSAENIVGIREKDALNRHIKEVIPDSGLVNVLITGRPEVSQKIIINGRICVSHRTPIIINAEIWGAIVVFQDISDLEQITKELNAYTSLVEELDAIIQSSSDGIYVTDGDGYTIRVNKAYEEITGIKKEEVIGKHMKQLVEQGYYSQSATLLVLNQKKPVTIMQRIKDSKDVMVTGNPVMGNSGEIKFVVTSVRDVTSLTRLQREFQRTKALSDKYHDDLKKMNPSNMIIESPEMMQLLTLARQISPYPTTVLIQGESGVGKELVAEFIHRNSNRADNNFIKVNCGAIPENLLESELFGYEEGAFTGAQKKGKPGMFELAHRGMILLDEIAELPLNLQVKLLRVIQEGEVTRLGGIKSKKIDVRVISSSNKDLESLVQKGLFREDLFYRLNVVSLKVPPLRNRKRDIMALANYFLETFNKNYGLNKTFSSEIQHYFENYSWPGNIRQLKNLIENLVVSIPADTITSADLPKRMVNIQAPPPCGETEGIISLREAVSKAEIELIKKALAETKSLRKAARLLKISHSTLSRKINKYSLNELVHD